MSVDINLLPTGNQAIDELQIIQLEAVTFSDDAARKSFISRRVGSVPCELLIDKHLGVITEGVTYGYDPVHDRLQKVRLADISFNAPAASLSYEKYHRAGMEPVKSIMIGFVFPTITAGILPKQVKTCYDLALKVPVLAIKSCIDA